jgi:hypothetical protein
MKAYKERGVTAPPNLNVGNILKRSDSFILQPVFPDRILGTALLNKKKSGASRTVEPRRRRRRR